MGLSIRFFRLTALAPTLQVSATLIDSLLGAAAGAGILLRDAPEEMVPLRCGMLMCPSSTRKHPPWSCVPLNGMSSLASFIGSSRRLVVLTGAGCSTESGIPDYRSPGGAWTRHKPIYYNSFVRSAEVRRFYWARSYRGWPRFAGARPNDAHAALARLEKAGRVHQLITQNVDDLHHEAGSRAVVQLHGRNRLVVCLDCRHEFARADIQERLYALNGEWLSRARWDVLHASEADFAPDGDAQVGADLVSDFAVPECERCGGVLKPHVVFFGETVPPEKVAFAMSRLDESDALLVVGSSLTVWSGFRFVKRAGEHGVPVAIVNIGPTRGDDLASLKVEARCGKVLTEVVEALFQ